MKKLLWAIVLVVPFLAWPTPARAFDCGPFAIDTGAKAWFNVRWGNCGFGCATGMAGPWYLYYPYQAYFNTPAPGPQFFPGPMTLPPNFYPAPYPPMGAMPYPQMQQNPQMQPYPQMQPVPTGSTPPAGMQRVNYWYGYWR
jgi:hypothetical protein